MVSDREMMETRFVEQHKDKPNIVAIYSEIVQLPYDGSDILIYSVILKDSFRAVPLDQQMADCEARGCRLIYRP